jgi:hypothetical protein
MKPKTDIFVILNKISSGDTNYIDTLSEEELKSISPYVIQMWIKGADSNLDARMVLTNELVNKYVFSLADHKKLLYKLLCVANGYGDNPYYKFKKKKESSCNNLINLIAEYYKQPLQHAKDSLKLLSIDSIVEIAELLGRDKKDIKKLKEEYTKNEAF